MMHQGMVVKTIPFIDFFIIGIIVKEYMNENYPLFFIRHGKLSLPYKDHSKMPFSVQVNLGLEKLNPTIDRVVTLLYLKKIKDKVPLEDIEKIYTSPSRRCWDTSKLITKFIKGRYDKNVEIEILENLREIKFDLRKIFKNGDNLNLASINNGVLEAMIKENNDESFKQAYRRIDSLFKKLNKKNKSKKYLLITHDFLMRVIEIYIKSRGSRNINITTQGIQNTKRHSYLEGFKTNFSLSSFSIINAK